MKKEITLELVENPGRLCGECLLHVFQNCVCIMKCINLYCEGGKYRFKIKKNFEPCTKENTKVGDPIYSDNEMPKRVEYIFKTPFRLNEREHNIIFSTNTQTEIFGNLKDYKKEI